MSRHSHQEAPVSYPPPATAYPPPPVTAPPRVGYPTGDGPAGYPQQGALEKPTTTSRGDGFWKGCCAGLCCCCALDMCF